MLQALIVDDDDPARELLARIVTQEGFSSVEARSLAEARERLESDCPDIALLDLRLPDGDGLDLLNDLERVSSCPEVVILTGDATVSSAVAALRSRATDYLIKPLDVDRLVAILVRCARARQVREELEGLRKELRQFGRFGQLVGSSAPMQDMYDLVGKVAPTSATVLLVGESGTGKEVVAQTVHELSRRRGSPFVAVNCGAVSANLIESELFGHTKGSFTGATQEHKGYFERAHTGTLFLDEITEMPVELQVKLLRVLETSTVVPVGSEASIVVDVRVIAATNRSPEEAVKEGKLREDLYYRLQVFPIRVPTLRERPGDVEVLTRHFLRRMERDSGQRKSISRGALEVLRDHAWPGNVRQLKNVLNRAFIVADDEIRVKDLPPPIAENAPEGMTTAPARKSDSPDDAGDVSRFGGTLASIEKLLIVDRLERMDGDKKAVAESLGISLRTLYNRLEAYDQEEAELET